jgi:amino acid adenylation domain-containing protein
MLESLYAEFRARKQEQPDVQAVRWGHASITYAELDEGAAALAAELAEAGVSREELVGIATSRGPGLIVAMLAVMRAGAAWVPLDPAYPPARLRHMIEDSGVALVLADGPASAKLPPDLHWIDVDSAPRKSGAGVDTAFAWPDAKQLAYVIYTSGSTGRPKGVLIEHGAVAATVTGMRDAFGVERGDRVLQFSSMSFDASICEVGIALTAGATLVIADDGARLPGVELVSLLERERVSIAVLPPSVVAALPDTALPNLRTLVCAGEALPAELAWRWGRGRRLVNAYGPTEVAICATAGDVAIDETAVAKPNIGHPLPGVRLEILDARSQPVEPGDIGELAVGGVGVGRGYLRRPELTDERFIRNASGERWYRTGDLVRQLANGAYDFIGRADHQLKLHGFRIEPEEIADVLRAHDAVRDAVVVARAGRLLAYAAVQGAQPGGLRRWCEERLPAHMVPSAVVVLASLPLTPSGKVDRDALPAPDRVSAGLSELRTAARTATEATLTRLVSELLGVPEVGVDDDFFALGGHSLLVGRLAAKIRAVLGVEIALTEVYRAPTVAGMATIVDGDRRAGETPPVPPALVPVRRDGPLPLSFPQERVWFLEQIVPGNLAYQAQATLRIAGPLDRVALNAALTEMVRRHEIFRTAFKEESGTPVQEIREPFVVDVPIVELLDCSEAEFERLAADVVASEIQRRFRPDEAPLVRWLLIRHSATRHVLLHAEHHLIHDGWSFAVFIDELRTLYEAFKHGEPSPLPEPSLQFADFAAWQRRWLSGDTLTTYLSHWTARLQNLPAPLSLPTDRPRPPAFRFSGDAIHEDFDPFEYAALRQAARTHGVTLFTVMLAGFATLLSRYADQEDLVVGVGSANRRLAEAERLIGMVINTLPLRVNVADDPPFSEVLRRVHYTAIEGYAWQDVPLDRLVDALALPRDPSRNPLFSVIFSFHDAAVPDLAFGRLKAQVQVEHNGSAKADLNIVVIPRAEQRVGRTASEEDQSLTMIWEYADDLFDRSSMDAMLASYHRLLSAALSDPSTPVSRLPLVAPPATDPVGTGESAAASARQLFERWVAARPDGTAVSDWTGRSLTYQALDVAATALAQRLVGQGAGVDSPVVIPPARGLNLVVTLVACMKVDAPWVIDHVDEAANIAAGWQGVASAVSALQAAGFVADRVIQLADVGSPSMLLEVATALLSGASLRLVDAVASDPKTVAASMQREYEAHGRFSAVLSSALVNALAARFPRALAGIDSILAMGHDIDVHALQRCGLSRVLLGLGCASAPLVLLGDWSATDACEAHRPAGCVGRPVGGIDCALLDRHGAPVPVGVAGSLHVRPHGSPQRVRTGWRARRLADERVQVLDRAGSWLELGGFRVDPSQSCGVLRSHPSVAEAAVVPRKGRLVAYVVIADGAQVTEQELRAHVADRIAGYQTPQAFVFLDALPLDPFGELDAAALPDATVHPMQAYRPRTATEERIAATCAVLLGLEDVDPHTDFFLLGGRSLLATRLVAQVNREFGASVTVARFLRRPTVADLAAAVDDTRKVDPSDELRPSARRNAAALLADLDRLTDEEVQNLLEEMKGAV